MPVRLNGSTSGFVELAAPAVAGSTTLELPTDSIKPGLVLVAQESFSAVSSVSVDGCFSSEYDNYLVHVNKVIGSSASNAKFRLRSGGVDDSSSTWAYEQVDISAATVSPGRSTSTNSGMFGVCRVDTNGSDYQINIYRPFLAVPTNYNTGIGYDSYAGAMIQMQAGTHGVSSSFDGITVFPASGTITGSLSIFAYRNTL